MLLVVPEGEGGAPEAHHTAHVRQKVRHLAFGGAHVRQGGVKRGLARKVGAQVHEQLLRKGEGQTQPGRFTRAQKDNEQTREHQIDIRNSTDN